MSVVVSFTSWKQWALSQLTSFLVKINIVIHDVFIRFYMNILYQFHITVTHLCIYKFIRDRRYEKYNILCHNVYQTGLSRTVYKNCYALNAVFSKNWWRYVNSLKNSVKCPGSVILQNTWYCYVSIFSKRYQRDIVYIIISIITVSYTHLDVYKRQEVMLGTANMSVK